MKVFLAAVLALPLLVSSAFAGEWQKAVECSWNSEKVFGLKIEKKCKEVCLTGGTYVGGRHCYQKCDAIAVITEEHSGTEDDAFLPIEYFRNGGFFYPGAKTDSYVIKKLLTKGDTYFGWAHPEGKYTEYSITKIADNEVEVQANRPNGTYSGRSRYIFRDCIFYN